MLRSFVYFVIQPVSGQASYGAMPEIDAQRLAKTQADG